MLFKNRNIAVLFAGLFVVMMGFGIIIQILPAGDDHGRDGFVRFARPDGRPGIAGWLYHFHINLPYSFGAGIVLVGALIALPAFQRQPAPATVPEPEPVD